MPRTPHPIENGTATKGGVMSARTIGTAIMLLVIVGATAVVAVLLMSRVGISDEAGRPLGVPAVSITPAPAASPSATPTPTGSADDHGGTSGSDDGSPEVVPAEPPVVVDLTEPGDDHGGSSGNSGKGGGDD